MIRLAKHVPPKVNESLVGFLMRAAETNHLQNISALYALLGRKSRPPTAEDIERLAVFCGCSNEEIAQLFGFQCRRSDGIRAWRLGGEWVTKANFISSRFMAVCCECLREEPYLPGTWELTFYCCCAFHHTRLLTACPKCGRQLRWTRPKVWQCSCGFDLRQTSTEIASPHAWITAQLIENRLDTGFQFVLPADVSHRVVERLGKLSLDGLFKTIWFLGHCIGGFETCTAGHGRLKRKNGNTETTIATAFALLKGWPESLGERLDALLTRKGQKCMRTSYRHVFGPLISYLEQESPNEELAFVRLAYEQEVHRLWQKHRRKPPKKRNWQMSFNFDNTARETTDDGIANRA